MANGPATTTPRPWPSPATMACPRKKHGPWKGIGHCHLCDGHPSEANACLEQALAIYQRIAAPAARCVQETLTQLRQDNLAPAPEP
jgi:molybdopterin/thiamine biosynthesis adenylyltransferase